MRGSSIGFLWSAHRLGSRAGCLWRREPAAPRTVIQAVVNAVATALRLLNYKAIDGKRDTQIAIILPSSMLDIGGVR